MSESPTEKRMRTLSAGPRHKRDSSEMASQMRAFNKSTRKPRLEPEVKAIAEKIAEIKKLEEAIKMVELLKAQADRPYYEAVARLKRAQDEFTQATAQVDHLANHRADVTEFDERQDLFRRSIGRLQEEVETMYKNAIDASSRSA